MLQVAARTATRDEDAGRYQRHRTDQSESCYAEHLVVFSRKRRDSCPSCVARRMAESAALLADKVPPEQPVRQSVLSIPFQLRFLFASPPEMMGRVLGMVYRVVAAHLVKKAGYTKKSAQKGAVTLIQRFGSALNLNIHLHMLFLYGVYIERCNGLSRFRWVKAPTSRELAQLVHTITCRTAVGPQAGRKVFTLQALPACDPEDEFGDTVGKVAGFSLHAGVGRPGPMSATSWNGCAGTSAAGRYQKSACRRRPIATFATKPVSTVYLPPIPSTVLW